MQQDTAWWLLGQARVDDKQRLKVAGGGNDSADASRRELVGLRSRTGGGRSGGGGGGGGVGGAQGRFEQLKLCGLPEEKVSFLFHPSSAGSSECIFFPVSTAHSCAALLRRGVPSTKIKEI